MRYLCLIYGDEAKLSALPPEQIEPIVKDCHAYVDQLRGEGRLILSEGLESAANAVNIRVRDGRVSVTDGPYIETKEQVGGFYLIEAKDFNEAIRIASRIPPAQLGAVEVRAIDEEH